MGCPFGGEGKLVKESKLPGEYLFSKDTLRGEICRHSKGVEKDYFLLILARQGNGVTFDILIQARLDTFQVSPALFTNNP